MPLTTLQELVHRLADRGEDPALIVVGPRVTTTISYAALGEAAGRAAAELHSEGVGRGDPVGILAPNSAAWVTACLGILAAGGALMPLDVRQGEAERAALTAASGCRYLYAGDELRRLDGPLSSDGLVATTPSATVPIATPEDVALLLHTSGTTGTPKAVPLTHANVTANLRALAEEELIDARDRALLPLPLHHVYPLVVGLLLPLSIGASIVLPAGISGPELARALNVSRANTLVGVPRLYSSLLGAIRERVKARGAAADRIFQELLALSVAWARRGWTAFGRIAFSSVRRSAAPALFRLASGGAALDEATERALVGLGYDVIVGYGLTETSPLVTFNRPGRARIGSAGQALPGVEVRIARADADGIGEIEVRGPNVFAGYRDDPAATRNAFTSDGWFRTGDVGRTDADGYLYVHGRSSETLVLPGGEKLNPEIVEAGYAPSPIIAEIAVLVEGGRLVALVVPPGGLAADESAIRVELTARANALPRYMQLAGFALADGPLPRTELGKLRRHLLPPLYRAARLRHEAVVEERRAWSPADRALIEEPRARPIWAWLEARFPNRRLSPEMSLQLDLGVDSLEWITITMDLERALGITLDEAAIQRVVTLRDLVDAAVAAAPAAAAGAAPVWLEEPGIAGRGIWYIGHAAERFLARLLFRVRAEGVEHLPPRGPYILCANHVSYLDPPVLAAALPWAILPQVSWAASVDVMFSSLGRRIFSRLARVLPIDPARGARASLEISVEALKRGRILAWWPEGWLSEDGTLQPFLPGIGALVLSAPVPIVPVYIKGTFAAWPSHRRFPRPGRVSVRFGPPLDASRWKTVGTREETEQSIAAEVRAAVASLER